MDQAETFKIALKTKGRILSGVEIDEIASEHEAQVTHHPNASVPGATTHICEFDDGSRVNVVANPGWHR